MHARLILLMGVFYWGTSEAYIVSEDTSRPQACITVCSGESSGRFYVVQRYYI